MSQRTLTRRLVFSLLATAAFFGLLEGTLWGAGAVALAWARARMPAVDPQGAPTLLCLGDSVTFGLGAATEDAYPAKLALSLPGWTVVNLGRPGFRTEQAAGELEGWLAATERRGPTRALLLAGFNDCGHMPGLLVVGEDTPRPAPRLLRQSRLYRLATQLVRRLQPPPSEAGHALDAPQVPVDPAIDLGRCAFALGAGLDHVQRLCDDADIPLSLLTYPVPALFQSDSAGIDAQVDDLIAAEAADRGLPLLDLRPCMRVRETLSNAQIYQADGIHLSAEGYAAMAACVAAALEEEAL